MRGKHGVASTMGAKSLPSNMLFQIKGHMFTVVYLNLILKKLCGELNLGDIDVETLRSMFTRECYVRWDKDGKMHALIVANKARFSCSCLFRATQKSPSLALRIFKYDEQKLVPIMVRTVKAMVTSKPGKMELQRFPYPDSVPKDALMAKLRMTGICGTDHHIFSGQVSNLSWPIIQGHEMIAEVYEAAENIGSMMESNGEVLVKGDAIAIYECLTCGKCWSCRWLANNVRMLCEKPQVYGFSLSCRDPPYLTGGFAEYLYVKPGTWIYKIPKDIPDGVAVLVDTLASTSAIDRAISRLPQAREGFMWGDVAVVQGAGPIGVMAALKFKEFGASKVIMVGGPDRRLTLAEKFGVDYTINIEEEPKAENRIRRVLELTNGRGADIVFEGAGIPAAFPEGIEMVRRGGIYLEVGNWSNAGSVPFDPQRICFKDIVIIGLSGFSPQQYERDLNMLYKWWRKKEYPLLELITHRLKMEETEKGIGLHRAWKSMKIAVVP